MDQPLANFITFTTYGSWLHGRAPGSVDAIHNEPGTPFLPADIDVEHANRNAMNQDCYLLDKSKREVVLRTVLEVAAHRKWKLWAVHVRTTHVHVVVIAPVTPEKIMSDFKAWCSRRLREQFNENKNRKHWSEHGSTKYAWRMDQLEAWIEYTVTHQGEPMAVHQDLSEPEA
jgi:REP element-mobilizing transposase RayT